MIKSLHLTVLTPAHLLLDAEEIKWVKVQLADGGGISIWPGHAPLLAETVVAPLRYADAKDEHILDLDAGILYIESNRVTVFTSGLAGKATSAAAISGAPTPIEDEQDAHFDRLARTLLTTLGAQPEERADQSSVGQDR